MKSIFSQNFTEIQLCLLLTLVDDTIHILFIVWSSSEINAALWLFKIIKLTCWKKEKCISLFITIYNNVRCDLNKSVRGWSCWWYFNGCTWVIGSSLDIRFWPQIHRFEASIMFVWISNMCKIYSILLYCLHKGNMLLQTSLASYHY